MPRPERSRFSSVLRPPPCLGSSTAEYDLGADPAVRRCRIRRRVQTDYLHDRRGPTRLPGRGPGPRREGRPRSGNGRPGDRNRKGRQRGWDCLSLPSFGCGKVRGVQMRSALTISCVWPYLRYRISIKSSRKSRADSRRRWYVGVVVYSGPRISSSVRMAPSDSAARNSQ